MSNELELQELIREVAKAKATFLRVPPRDVKRTLYERRPRVESTSTFLSSVERHLLDVYREELARALHMICLQLLFSPGRRIPHSRSITLHEEVEILTTERIRHRVQGALCVPPVDNWTEEALMLLKRCVADVPETQPSVSQLASASLRLAPSDQARTNLALDLWESGQAEEALVTIRKMMTCCASALALSIGFENCGAILASMSRFHEALAANKKAAALEYRIGPLISVFLLCVQMGQDEEAIEASHRISDMLKSDHCSVLAYTTPNKKGRENGVWRPTKESKSTTKRIADRVGPAKSLLDVFYD